MLHEARTGHLRPLRARANRLSRQPSTSPLPLPVGAEGGQGEGEGAPAVRRSTNADTGATLFQLITETHTLPANVSLTITALIASQSVPTIRRTGGPEARVPRLVHR
jgi:hypothetical protein